MTRAWLPLYLFCVLAATQFPFWVHCAPGDLDLNWPIHFDLAQNVLMFWPLGYALRRRSELECILIALVFSLAIESAQLWILRSPSPWDIITNVLGAALAWRTADRMPVPRTADVLALIAFVGAVVLLALSLFSAPYRLGNGFEGWETMPLLIGNELSEDRPWSGNLAELAVYDHAPQVLPTWDADGPPDWQAEGPVHCTRSLLRRSSTKRRCFRISNIRSSTL